jgi:hypothetical protein
MTSSEIHKEGVLKIFWTDYEAILPQSVIGHAFQK